MLSVLRHLKNINPHPLQMCYYLQVFYYDCMHTYVQQINRIYFLLVLSMNNIMVHFPLLVCILPHFNAGIFIIVQPVALSNLLGGFARSCCVSADTKAIFQRVHRISMLERCRQARVYILLS